MTFENIILMILEEGHVKIMRTSVKACTYVLVDNIERGERDRQRLFGAPFSLATPLRLKCGTKKNLFLQINICVFGNV